MQLDFQRYEYKYIIPERMAQPIREFVACYTKPDRFTEGSATRRYIITSLYLDSPQLTFHLAKERKALNRVKLRIRTYGERADGPIFCEIKRKIKGVIFKRRVQVSLSQPAPNIHDLFQYLTSETERDRGVMSEFIGLCAQYTAEPSMLVRYSREAYESEIDDYGRVTFDRYMQGHLPQSLSFEENSTAWLSLDDPVSIETPTGTVLELKFANQAPRWMADLVQFFGLQRRGFSKYSTAVFNGLSCYHPPDIRTSTVLK